MKRRKIRIVIAALCVSMICGCGNQNGNGNGQENSQGSSQAVSEQAVDSSSEEKGSALDGESIVAKEQESQEPENTESESEEVKVSNNGGYFVGVEDKVYFRRYGDFSLEMTTLYGDFLGYEVNYDGNAEIQYLETGKETPVTVCTEDAGYGRLYYHDGYLYSCRDENFDENTVYRISLADGKSEKVANGKILGGSKDGRYLAVNEYRDGQGFLGILDAGKQSNNQYSAMSGYYSYVGSDEDKVFFLLFLNDEVENVYLMQYDYAGNLVNLAKMPKDENAFMATPEIHNFVCEGGKLSFTWEYYEGTGHFLSSAFQVEVPECMNAVGADSNVPKFEAKSEALTIWSESQLGEYDEDYLKAQIRDPQVEEKREQLTKWPEGNGMGQATIPQTVEKVGDGLFCMVARAHRDGLEDIGWREAYSLMEMRYFYYPEGSQKPVELSKVYWSEAPLTGCLWLVGKPGEECTQAIYQLAAFNGPEVAPEFDEHLYGAELSPDLVFEFPEDQDIYGDWTRGNIQDFYREIAKNKKSFLSKTPKLNDYEGYEKPNSWSPMETYAYHIGFDDQGRINYVRPVVMD